MDPITLRNEIKRIILSECRLENEKSSIYSFELDDQGFYVPNEPKNFIQNVLKKIEAVKCKRED